MMNENELNDREGSKIWKSFGPWKEYYYLPYYSRCVSLSANVRQSKKYLTNQIVPAFTFITTEISNKINGGYLDAG